MSTMQRARPSWYTHDDDTAWDRVKEAFRRDWKQTKHDFGGNEPNLNQQVGDTMSQAVGSKPIPPPSMPNQKKRDDSADVHENQDIYDENQEEAYRFGFAAFRHHGRASNWDPKTEAVLRNEWGDEIDWPRHREAVRRGWFFGKNQGGVDTRKM